MATKPQEAAHELNRLVRQFEEADRVLREAIERRNLDEIRSAFNEAVTAKRKVKHRLAATDEPLPLSSSLAAKLRRIRDNRYYTIDLLSSLDTSDELDWEGYPDGFLMDLWASFELADEIGGNPILRRAGAIGTLVIAEEVPAHIGRRLITVKRCFAVGLFDAAVVFCRSLTEAAVAFVLEERGDLPGGPKPGSFDLLERVAPYVPSAALAKAHRVRKHANDLLHPKKSIGETSEMAAQSVIRDTFQFIERLFQ